jgi:Sulfotransferase domain
MARSSLPDFLIIGAMRSGTSSLAWYLRGHPQVCMSPTKEIHFFDRNFERGIDWYRAHFDCGSDRARGEATQTYMYDMDTPKRMSTVIPNARLIAVLRDPVDRAYSHYWLNRERGREPLTFSQAVAAEASRLANGGLTERFWYSYVDRGRYVHQLKRVVEYFPRDRLHVLLFDDLRDAPIAAYRSICRFLEIDDDPIPQRVGAAVNPHVAFRSLRVRNLAKRLPGRLAAAIGRLNNKRSSYPPLDPAIRNELVERLRPDLVGLQSWLGRDLSTWLDVKTVWQEQGDLPRKERS